MAPRLHGPYGCLQRQTAHIYSIADNAYNDMLCCKYYIKVLFVSTLNSNLQEG